MDDGRSRFIKSKFGFNFVVPLFIALNVFIFLGWNILAVGEGSLNFMLQNFLVSWTGVISGRFWLLLTSVFSHQSFLHLFMNMLVLGSFAPTLETNMGSWRFLKFYLIAGVFSSFCHIVFSSLILGQPDLPALGASGAVSGVILLFSLIYPQERILIFGILPIPALWGAILFVGLDVWGLFAQAGGGGLPIGHGAHLGGAFVGAIYYFLFFARRKQRYERVYDI